MYLFFAVTVALFIGLAFTLAITNREEIRQNWAKYRYDPLYMFAAPLFKPDDDTRSRMQFGVDNFKDAVNQNINDVFLKFLQPVFSIFRIFLDATNQSVNGLFNIRMLIGKYWNAFNRMIDPFMRRFNMTFHQLRMTFIKLNQSFAKVLGMTTSAVYTGLSTIATMTSFLDLMMKVIIIILVILVVMVILLFFVLWPFIPTILAVIAIISASVMGGAVGGMADTFCFGQSTQIETKNGPVAIEHIRNGDVLSNGAIVQGIMHFKTSTNDLYNLYGVQVSGSHIVYHNNNPEFVYEHVDAIPIPPPTSSSMMLYCLITNNHRIPVRTTEGIIEFADWEEISEDSDLERWHNQVFETLNPGCGPAVFVRSEVLHSEAVVSGRTKIWTNLGPVEIRGLNPGDTVLDGNGRPTIVKGVVCVDESQVRAAVHLGGEAWISAAAWTSTNKGKTWSHPEHPTSVDGIREWYSLFTESGTFRLCEIGALDLQLRDFTDLGPDHIHETYDWVLESLAASTKTDN